MTIGSLSRRTGVPVKTLREYEDLGLIYTLARSPGNYRQFGDEALWCVGVIGVLRGLGLTLTEIRDVTKTYLAQPDKPIGPRLAQVLEQVRARTEGRMTDLRELLTRIDDYETRFAAQLAGQDDFPAQDPRHGKSA